MKRIKFTTWILIAMVLGVLVGYLCHAQAPSPEAAKEIAGYFSIVTDIFLRLIKMIIAPLVFATIVGGIAGMGNAKEVGRIGLKALAWFLSASFVSLLLGLILADLFQPGVGLNLPLPDAGAATHLKTGALNLKDFVAQIFPKSFFDAMAQNAILQILVFAIFFGFALASIRDETANTMVRMIDDLTKAMLRVTDYVMRFAPFAIFAAIAAAITVQGLGVLVTYGRFMGSFYAALLVLWGVLILGGFLFLGKSTFRLLRLIREPMVLAFSTASSESAYPRTMAQLEKFGVRDKVTGLVLPLGYSFNLDGSMIYMTFAALFIAQVYGVELSLSQQITMLLVLMVSSKGIAGVPRASLVVIAAVLPMYGLPEAGLLLIMGVDHFLDMGRSATNVLGNSLATAVVARLEGELTPQGEEDAEPDAAAESALPELAAPALAAKNAA